VVRLGLNTSLTYQYGGKNYAFSVRTAEVDFGSQMVADEAQARTRRAFYPHTVSAVPFSLVVIIKGYRERVQFSNFLNDFVSRTLDPSLSVSSFPTMRVQVASRNFIRWGIPLSGLEWGDHIGSMVWTPRVVFETHVDQSLGETVKDYKWVSYFQLDASAVQASPQIKYFYPSGVQLSGSQVPDAGAFDKVTSIQDIQNIINGGTSGGSDVGSVDPVTGVNPINNGMPR
jgi:hypothetical protein